MAKIADRPTVLLPVETVVRELNSKLALAAALAGQGLRVVVGHKEEVTQIGRASLRLVWQGKNLFSDDDGDHTADHLLRNGSSILYVQDEGGMFQVKTWTANVIQKHHLAEVRTRRIARMCAWGRAQAQVIAGYAPEVASAVRVTGSARFDLCDPRFSWMERDRVRHITASFGDFILVCTRFGAIAHSVGIHDAFRRKLNPRIWPGDIPSAQVTDIWFHKWRQDVHDFAEFVVFLKELAETYRDRTIVIRPHPSESLLFYQTAFAGFPRVQVVREGNVLNWIRAASLVVHSNCTTGIEAVLAGVPVLNFIPGDLNRSDYDVEVAREAGVLARSVPEALDVVDRLLRGDYTPTEWSTRAVSVLENLTRDAIPLLVSETLSVLADMGAPDCRLVLPPRGSLRDAIRRRLGRATRSEYVSAKRGPLDTRHVEGILQGCTNLGFGACRVSRFHPHYVVIEP